MGQMAPEMPWDPFMNACPAQMISCRAMILARDVSFTSVMISLDMGGTMRLIICSSVTRKKIWLLVMPSTRPASSCPTGTLWIPPR